MTLYLVRHGRAVAGVEDLDPGLDDVGRAQAESVAQELAAEPIVRLVVSPMRRTLETIAPLAERLGIQPEVREEVSEVFDPAMPSDARTAMIGPFMQSTWAAQAAELQAWRRRVVDAVWLMAMTTAAKGGDLAIVSHYIAICVVIGAATNDDRVVPVPVANASISSFEVGDGKLDLLAAGATGHLPAAHVTGISTAILGPGPDPARKR